MNKRELKKHRYESLLQITKDIESFEDGDRRHYTLFLLWDCGYITRDLYHFLKRKLCQNAYLNGVTEFSYLIKIYFSQHDEDSFNHYVIKDKKEE